MTLSNSAHTQYMVRAYLNAEYGFVAMIIWWLTYCIQESWPHETGETRDGKWWVTTVDEMMKLKPLKRIPKHAVQYAIKRLRREGLLQTRRASYENRMQGWYRAQPVDLKLVADWASRNPQDSQKQA